MTIVIVTLAGAAGAACRYWLSGLIQHRSGGVVPVGTMAVNLLGAFALGLIVGVGNADAVPTLASAGFLGGFTTFSTWMAETVRLGILPRVTGWAVANALGVPALGVALAAIGYRLTG